MRGAICGTTREATCGGAAQREARHAARFNRGPWYYMRCEMWHSMRRSAREAEACRDMRPSALSYTRRNVLRNARRNMRDDARRNTRRNMRHNDRHDMQRGLGHNMVCDVHGKMSRVVRHCAQADETRRNMRPSAQRSRQRNLLRRARSITRESMCHKRRRNKRRKMRRNTRHDMRRVMRGKAWYNMRDALRPNI